MLMKNVIARLSGNESGMRRWFGLGFLLYLFLLPWQARYLFSEYSLETPFYGGLSLYATDLLFALLLIVWIASHASDIVNWAKAHRIVLCCFSLFLVFLFLSLLWSPEPFLGLIFALRVMQTLLLALMVMTVSVPIRAMLLVLLLAGVMQSLLALWQFFLQEIPASTWLGMSAQDPRELGVSVIESADERWLRAYGSLPHPNILGGFLSLCALIAAGWYFSVYRRLRGAGNAFFKQLRIESIGSLLAFLLTVSGLLLTFSRSAWLGFAVGFAALVLFARKGETWSTVFVPVLKLMAAGGIILCVFQLIFGPLWTQRIASESRLAVMSSQERMDLNETARLIIEKHPLRGSGAGQYVVESMIQHPGQALYAYQPVHNVWLLVWAELGLAGLCLFGLAVAFFYRTLLWLKRLPAFRIEAALSLSLMISLFTMFYFEHHWWTLWFGLGLTGVLLGFMLATMLDLQKRRGHGASSNAV